MSNARLQAIVSSRPHKSTETKSRYMHRLTKRWPNAELVQQSAALLPWFYLCSIPRSHAGAWQPESLAAGISTGERHMKHSHLTSAKVFQFAEKMQGFSSNLDGLFGQSRELEAEIKKQMVGVKYEN